MLDLPGRWHQRDVEDLSQPHSLCPPCKDLVSRSQILKHLPARYDAWEADHSSGKQGDVIDKISETFCVHDNVALHECICNETCHLCTLIWDALTQEFRVDPFESHRTDRNHKLNFEIVLESGGPHYVNWALMTFRIEDIELAPLHTEFPAQLAISTASAGSFALAQKWLQDCLTNHSSCGAQRQSAVWDKKLPTRLIQIADDGTARLVDGDGLAPDTRYTTLSHMWGTATFLSLLTTNEQQLYISIPADELSQTFRDALTITQTLGLNHIWIDSLCIIQNSASDWAHEAALMASIYGNSLLTIAASAPIPPSSGCFVRRTPLAQRPCKLLDTEIYIHTRQTPNWNGFSSIYYGKSPLLTRAWVQQERILSARVLYYSTELHWECCTTQASECWPHGAPLPQHGYDNEYPLKPAFEAQLKPWSMWTDDDYVSFITELWHQGLFYLYTDSKLTHEKDRMIALAGIAGAVQKRTGMHYIAGLWREMLPLECLWYVRRPGERRLNNTSWQAPSWSWACVTGAKSGSSQLLTRSDIIEYCVRMVSCEVNSNDGDQILGRISGGTLVLIGLMVPCLWLKSQGRRHSGSADTLVFLDSEEDLIGDGSGQDLQYLCIIQSLDEEVRTVTGLILQPSAQKGDETDDQIYTRMGYFTQSYRNRGKTIFEGQEEIRVTIK